MKAKLSFLALPLCLGLVLTFVLAACSSGGGTNGSGGSSSNSNTVYSSEIAPEGTVDIVGFNVQTQGERVYITATIEATKDEPIVKLEITGIPMNWLSYSNLGEFQRGVKTFILDAEIDLNEPSIKCSDNPHKFTVKACINDACGPQKYTFKEGEFNKPDYLCNLSSSGGAVSSSSEAVWMFGAPQFSDIVFNNPVTVGSGSVKATGDEGQPDIEVSNGKIRHVMSLGVDDDEIVPGKSYSSKESALGSKPAETSKLDGDDGMQNKEYYLIYLNDGGKYLIRFDAKTSWPDWPKRCTYWLATESP
jgi:hypothetical protein